MDHHFVDVACSAFAGPRYRIAAADAHVPKVAGLYALHGSSPTWLQLGLGAAPDARPLYVGKAERSLASRDLHTHFRTGCTGQSTVRRTFAALLRDELALRAVPRNPSRVADKPTHFALAESDDRRLTAWMLEHLELAVWPKPATCTDLAAVEVEVIRHWIPPLNIQANVRSPWLARIRIARRRMAVDASEWCRDPRA